MTALSLIISVRADDGDLEDFLDSLQAQTLSDEVECIFTVMGPDALQLRVAEALDDRGIPAVVTRASGFDVSTARRETLALATGEWVTFPNARDALGRNYVESLVAEVLEHGESVDAIAVPLRSLAALGWAEPHPGRTIILDGTLTGLPSDVSRLALRRAAVSTSGSATDSYFDEQLLIDLLAHRGGPNAVRIVGRSHYLRRPNPSSDIQTERLRRDADSYLSLVADLTQRLDEAHEPDSWTHRLAFRTVARLTAYENTTVRRSTTLRSDDGVRFRAALRALMRRFDKQLFEKSDETEDAADERRDVFLALQGQQGVAPVAHVVGVDVDESLMQLRHTRWSVADDEQFTHEGVPFQPRFTKLRAIEAFGAAVLTERIAWIPTEGDVRLHVDGAEVEIRLPDGDRLSPKDSEPALANRVKRRLRPGAAVGAAPPASPKGWRAAVNRARRTWLSKAAFIRALAQIPGVASGFDDAWLLMDRANMGRDNAEHLYRWLMQNHPEVNAWFVLRADSADFARLKAEGFRLVPYGSLRHQLLLNKTRQYLSSHVGIDVSRPIFDRYLLRSAPWTFTFLQHGVIHNDLSIWLNRQKMRLFVTSTRQEHAGIAGDDSPYIFTEREARLTGLPRFDTLRRIADAAPVADRRSIVIAPTWRNGLFEPAARPGDLRKPKAGFRESPFIQSILGVLNDDRLADLVKRGYNVTFLPHPNLAEHFPYDAIPAHVDVTSYDRADVQQLIGNAAVFLTDYSSVAFDAAFADAAVVYMHIDGGAVYGTTHTLFPGYFDFGRDGFGPVCTTVDAALDAVDEAVSGRTLPLYRERVRQTFPYWDESACERVFDAVLAQSAVRSNTPAFVPRRAQSEQEIPAP